MTMVGPHVSITEAVRLDCLIGRWPKVKQQKRENNRAQRRRIPSVTMSSIFFKDTSETNNGSQRISSTLIY